MVSMTPIDVKVFKLKFTLPVGTIWKRTVA